MPVAEDDREVADRQNRAPGFSTEALARARVLLIGAGGLGSSIGHLLARKGVGRLDICDHDAVEPSNLNRQFFFARDLLQPKALRLAHNLAQAGFLGSEIVGHHVAFTEESADYLTEGVHAVVCGVDNNRTRRLASQYFRARGIPAAFTAVSEQADYGWVFLQQRGACLGCVFPAVARLDRKQRPCRATPAVMDILQVMGGLAAYAVDSLLMQRPRHWNFRSVHLAGGSPDCVGTVEPRPGCALCGARKQARETT